VIAGYRALIEALVRANVDFAIIGAVAMVLHGSARVTRALDVGYGREQDNIRKLAAALKPFAATLRGAEPTLPFTLDARTIESGLNFTLTSKAGDIDLLGEVTGLGGFPVVSRVSDWMEIYGMQVRVLSLDGLERAKRATGRLKDLADLAEILEIRRRTGQ
jgi:hypothetical protein